MRFASFLSGGFTIMAKIHPAEKKLAKRTSVHCALFIFIFFTIDFDRQCNKTSATKAVLLITCLSRDPKAVYFYKIKNKDFITQ
jgi:hypothetical protein